MKPAFKIYPQYILSIFLITFLSFVSCKKDEPEVKINNPTLPPALADSLFTITYNTPFQYFSLINYPGFGDWDTVKYFYFNADQDTIVDFNFKTYISVTWLGTSTPYYS